MIENPVRIIHSAPIWLPQTQTWMFSQVKYLPDDWEVHIVCDRKQNLDQFNQPHIWCLQDTSIIQYYWEKGWRKLISPQQRSFLETIAKRINARIIHSHFGSNGWFDLKAANRAKTKHVVTFYGYDVNGLPVQDKRWYGRYRELFHSADAFLFEGPFMAKQVENLGCPPEKIRVHHLGISLDGFLYRPRSYKPGETLKVLIAATFNEKKGIPYALEALSRLQSMIPLEITLIGDSISTAVSKIEKIKILQNIEKGGLQGKIKLMGFQPYSVLVSEAYKHHLFLSPSVTAANGDTEGGAPVTLIEMMASGMPVVSTKHCDIPEVVQYEIPDWLADERDVDGLVNRMQWLVENYGSWREILDNGRKHIETEYDAVLQGKRLGKIYQDVLS